MQAVQLLNYNESAVRGEIQRIRRQGGDLLCRCPLCESDVISLALASLPPCYGRGGNSGAPRGMASPHFVAAAVRKAVLRVSASPKHPPEASPFRRYQVRVVNYCLEAGAPLAAEVLHRVTARCRCRSCQLDVLTLTLNRFPPLYGVDCEGRTNLPPDRKVFLGLEVERAMVAAARIVASGPGH